MLFSRVSASLTSVTDLSLHRRSAGALARGHILERKLVESTYSAHRQASPPTTREYWSAVPAGRGRERGGKGKGEGRGGGRRSKLFAELTLQCRHPFTTVSGPFTIDTMLATQCVWVCTGMLTVEVLWITFVVLQRGERHLALTHSETKRHNHNAPAHVLPVLAIADEVKVPAC